jgi:thioredoxin-disulfide reductase
MVKYDVIIIGGGAAGLTAAIYASRRAMKTLVISQDIGGQASTTPDIENYPGFESINGSELMNKFHKQAEKFGAEFVFDEVKQIKKNESGTFYVITVSEKYESATVILAFGLSHRHLGVPGEDYLTGRGVSYCATCDGPLYKGKRVVVVGGGNSALDAAIYLSKIASQVYLIHRQSTFKGEAFLIDRLAKLSNVELVREVVVTEIKGEQRVQSIVVTPAKKTDKTKEIPVDGVFIEIGCVVKADFIRGLVDLDEKDQINITPDCETSTPGIFAAGDVTTVTYKQIIVSAGEGCKAALQAYMYVQKKRGKKGVIIDWK